MTGLECQNSAGRCLMSSSDGGSTDYYQLPENASELNDLIEHKEMSFALGNIFKACYRFGEKDTASRLYDLNKIIYFADRLRKRELRAMTHEGDDNQQHRLSD